jgi:small subunit ribosomal protein S6
MNNYELTVILRNKDLDTLKDKVKGILEKNKVNITLDEPKGNKKLAYQVEGEKEAYYLFMKLEATPESIDKIVKEFKLDVNILRHLFIAIKPPVETEKKIETIEATEATEEKIVENTD